MPHDSWIVIDPKLENARKKQNMPRRFRCIYVPLHYVEPKISRGTNVYNIWPQRQMKRKIRVRKGRMFGSTLHRCYDVLSHILAYSSGVGKHICQNPLLSHSPFDFVLGEPFVKKQTMCGKCYQWAFGVRIFVTCIGCNIRRDLSEHNHAYQWCDSCWLNTLVSLGDIQRAQFSEREGI